MNLMTIITVLIVFGVLVTVHEAGHFFVAKAFGTRVYEFAIGMGPSILKRKKGETIYSLHLLPVGGYVRFSPYEKPKYNSVEEEEKDTKEYEIFVDDERHLENKPAWQRLMILFAGSCMNLILAIILFAGIFTYAGYSTTKLDLVDAGKPAYEAGILPGDKVLYIDGSKIKSWTDIVNNVSNAKGETISFQVERNGEILNFEVEKIEVDGQVKVGITPVIGHSFFGGLKYSFVYTWAFMKEMVDAVGTLFNGSADINDFSGPVGMVTVVDQAVEHGLIYVVNLTAMLSVNLAIFNLLPIPALDGGRIVITFIEVLRGGKKLPQKFEVSLHLVGFVLLFSFIIFLTYKDILRIIGS